MKAVARRWCWRLGVTPQGDETDQKLVAASEQAMRDNKIQPDTFFYDHRGGRNTEGELGDILSNYNPIENTHPYWSEGAVQSMLVDEVETLWSAIAERDDWAPLEEKIIAIRQMGDAHGPAPMPAGHKSI